jgi:carbamoyl-phosphate synthase large subunit
MKILITGAGGPATDSLWRHWGTKHEIYFADMDIRKIHPCIPEFRRRIVPTALNELFLSEIKRLINELDIDLIISQVDEELVALKGLEKSNSKLRVMSPGIDFIETCLDKLQLGNQLSKLGLSEPNTRALVQSLAFGEGPVIAKPISGRGSKDIYFAHNKDQFEGLKGYLLSREENFVVQDLIDGVEFTIQMISDDAGNLSAIVPLQVLEKRGSTTQCQLNIDPVVLSTCKQIHEIYRPSGTYNIQLILDQAKYLAYVIEINPRVSTTMCFALELGIDPIDIFCNITSNGFVQIPQEGMRLDRFWENLFSKLGSGD